MNGNTLYNVSDPVNPQDVATKEYADKRTHTHYYGPLIKGKYQFTFGENKENPVFSGFLIPQSGRIKKIAARFEGQNYDRLVGSIFSFFLTKNEEKTSNKVSRLHT